MNRRSICFRLVTWYTALLVIFFLVFGVAVYFGLDSYLVKAARRSLTDEAKVVAQVVENADGKGEASVVAELTKRYTSPSDDQFIRVLRGSGTIIYQSSPAQYSGFDTAPLLSSHERSGKAYSTQIYLTDHHLLLMEGLPITTAAGNSYVVETGSLHLYIEGILAGVFITMSLGLPLFMATAIAGGIVLTGRALRPVDQITQQAERITSTSLSARLPVIRSGDQLERLSTTLNTMIGRLEEAFLHVNRFSGDVSHELRTPLTILTGELENMARQEYLTPELSENIGSALEETERLTKIVGHLLTLAQLDGDAFQNKTRIDLDEIVRTTHGAMALLAEEKCISIALKLGERIEIEGDPVRIAQVIANLLDNAIKYTNDGGHIDLTVTSRNDRAILEVLDDGIGIRADALPHLFERFYRADKSRTRVSGGTGLGLAIVKAICAGHEAQITIESKENSGTRVTVSLPLAGRRSITPLQISSASERQKAEPVPRL
jgi:heavy metal sensor kinase